MEKGKHKRIPVYRKIGYSFMSVYAVAVIILMTFLIRLSMIPAMYLAVFGGVFLLLGAAFWAMQRGMAASVIADILCVLFTVCCVIACMYIDKMDTTIRKVSTVVEQTDEVGVYVLTEDTAQALEDVLDRKIGMVPLGDGGNVEETIAEIEEDSGRKLDISEYEDMFAMLDGLKSGDAGAMIINSAFIGIAADAEGYEWVEDGVRQIAVFSHKTGQETAADPADEGDTFVVYLSGIDTYGDISSKSRSDVNILAVVNTKTKNILLVSTPRDYYIETSVSGGAKDKLTHAGIYGVDVSIDTLEQLYGVDINYYLRVNFTGFTEIIDALGGIEVYSQYEFTSRGETFYSGYNQVNGEQALVFARERYSFEDGDFQRGRNQMEVIKGVIKKAASSSMLANYATVMDAVAGSFETNMPQEKIADLVKMQLSDMAEWNITSCSATGRTTGAETFSMPGQVLSVVIPDEESVQECEDMINSVLNGSN